MPTRVSIDFADVYRYDRLSFTNAPVGTGAPRRPRTGTVIRITDYRITVSCDDSTTARINSANAAQRNLRLEITPTPLTPTSAAEAAQLLKTFPVARAAAQHLRRLAVAARDGDAPTTRTHLREAHRTLLAGFASPNECVHLAVADYADRAVTRTCPTSVAVRYLGDTRDIREALVRSVPLTDTWQISDPMGAPLGRVHDAPERPSRQAVVQAVGADLAAQGYGLRRLTAHEL